VATLTCNREGACDNTLSVGGHVDVKKVDGCMWLHQAERVRVATSSSARGTRVDKLSEFASNVDVKEGGCVGVATSSAKRSQPSPTSEWPT
jgi:hypothetical protein